MVRIMARNEVGVSDPLEPEDPVKMIRPPGNFSKVLIEVMIFYPLSPCLLFRIVKHSLDSNLFLNSTFSLYSPLIYIKKCTRVRKS